LTITYKVGNMLDKIKLWLYKINVLKKDTLINKIDYLLLLNIDLNSVSIQYTNINSFSNNINEYIDIIDKYLDFNLELEHIEPPVYTKYNSTFYSWYTSSDELKKLDSIVLLDWLSKAKQFILKIEGGIMLANLPRYQTNSIKLKPYIIDIEHIVVDILDKID